MDAKRIELPLVQEDMPSLRLGETLLLSGTLYTARDAAHARLVDLLAAGKPLPFPPGACIYYTGPCPAAPGEIIGPCGPTTSARMNRYTPPLIDYGVTALIGKGPLGKEARAALKARGVYLAATGGAGVLLARRVLSSRLIAFPELGAEAVYEWQVQDFPVIVATDISGRSLFDSPRP